MTHPQLAVPDRIEQVEIAQDGDCPLLKVKSGDFAGLADDFAAFTTGLLHTYGGLDVDPVREFVLTHRDRGVDVAYRDFDAPIFDGIARDASEEAWDRRLFFVEHRFWPDLKRFLLGIAISDARAGSLAEAVPSVVPLPGRPGRPRAFATAFGVSGNRTHVHLVGALGDACRPRVVHLPIDPRMARLAAAASRRGAGALEGPGTP